MFLIHMLKNIWLMIMFRVLKIAVSKLCSVTQCSSTCVVSRAQQCLEIQGCAVLLDSALEKNNEVMRRKIKVRV